MAERNGTERRTEKSRQVVKLARNKVSRAVTIEGCEVGNTYLRITPGMTRDQWVAVARRVTSIGHGYSWWLGDLADYAQHHLDAQAVRELATAAGVEMSSMRVIRSVARAYPVRERVEGLTIWHHRVVANLPRPKRQALLEQAKVRGWSAPILREHGKPRKMQKVRLMVRVPIELTSNTRFQRALRTFCGEWGLSTYGFVSIKTAPKIAPRLRMTA